MLQFLLALLVVLIQFPEKPSEENFFVDKANLISEEDREQINDLARSLLIEEDVGLIVVTIPSMASYGAPAYPIEAYAEELFNHWGIGKKSRNYGMLLLVSLEDRKARIELGADWGRRYDVDAKRVMNELIIPAFKRGDYSTGILDGVRGMDAMARDLQLPEATSPWWVMPLFIGLIVLAIGTIISLFRSGRSGWGWFLLVMLGGFLLFCFRVMAAGGGSGGAFGGGYSGGGGATGSW